MTAVEEIVAKLGLEPHPAEGGYFAETWRARENIDGAALPQRYGGSRSAGTAIYYLITPDSFSAMHAVASDEVFHFYLGDPVEMLQLHPDGEGRVARLGTDLDGGERPQLVVPAGVWQGSRLVAGGRFALLGATVAPGFDFADYSHGQRDELVRGWPEHASMIEALCR